MSEIQAGSLLDRPNEVADDSAKRRQILDGARRVFLDRGFDAASMMDIARAAGVSKGTLYVYFKDKDDLFDGMVRGECIMQMDGVFDFDPNDHDVEKVLFERGKNFVRALGDPHRLSSWRTVIAVAERMPEVGRKLYESGPARGLASLTAYLKAQVEAGILDIDDCEIAAAQFIETCHATMLKPMLFNFGPPPTDERIAYVVGIAVRTFLRAYKVR